MKSLKIEVRGLVQGVGFRPFVYCLARDLGLKGDVYNDSTGVKIRIQGESQICDEFIKRLSADKPPLSRIDGIEITEIVGDFGEFKIVASQDAQKIAPILPDFAICDDCKREFYDQKNRRYHHPFINCTNCGPRFSIISSLPYDRTNTTMREFTMCHECKSEYENPLDRRYHAQPIACKKCGASVFLRASDGRVLSCDEDAVKACAQAIKSGKIVAIKGIGGFHLICDARSDEVVNSLRIRKNRPEKPFAVMVKDLKAAREFADISAEEAVLLSSNIKPIVLVKSKGRLSANLAPNIDKIGVFIAPTALHLLLFEFIDFAIVATSANLSAEPIITDFNELSSKLDGVFDLALDNDRKILNPSDDSLAFIANAKTQWLRTSRGLKPRIFMSEFTQKSCFLALGSELKNQFAIYKDGQIFISPYIGDLKNPATFERFLSLIDMFRRIYELEFDFVVGDLHPYFGAARHFTHKGYEIRRIQHHEAHATSVMAEHNLRDALCFAFDGTGYGADGAIWGGEIFSCEYGEFTRIAHFSEFAMIGGEKAVKNIYYLTHAILRKYNIAAPEFYGEFTPIELSNLDAALKAASVKTSSLGRIFDAFCALKFGLKRVSYDAQAPMMMERFYDKSVNSRYEFTLNDGIIDFGDIFESAIKDEPQIAFSAFINSLACLIFEIAANQKLPVVLSGGVFASKPLLELVCAKFERAGIKYFLPLNEPVGDGGIALGQIYSVLNSKRLK